MKNNSPSNAPFLRTINMALVVVLIVLVLIAGLCAVMVIGPDRIIDWLSDSREVQLIESDNTKPDVWLAPDSTQIPDDENGKLILYGRALIRRTSQYLGPKGSVKSMSNGMNCQNCHLEAGTKPFGNNYSAVASTYPKLRARSGTKESIEKRVNDCIERSLNGQLLENESHEMKAIVAYIKWLGKDVEKGKTPNGAGLLELAFLDRPASAEKGKLVYTEKCMVCHGINGEGVALADGTGYQFPPLWGEKSYNLGAGLYRLSRFAGYVKANMPFGASYNAPQLTDDQAWDVAAYVNSLPRPSMDLSKDWPDISKKPIDHPFGPYTDGFDQEQHKLGPFKPIQEKRKLLSASR